MTYKVTIEVIKPPVTATEAQRSYPSTETVYEQTVEKLDVLRVIRAVNGVDA